MNAPPGCVVCNVSGTAAATERHLKGRHGFVMRDGVLLCPSCGASAFVLAHSPADPCGKCGRRTIWKRYTKP